MVTVILCVFLLSYMYGEGKSNYFSKSSKTTPCQMISLNLRRGEHTRLDVLGGNHGFLLLRLEGGGCYENALFRPRRNSADGLQNEWKGIAW